MAELLSLADLPGEFTYPPEFVRVVEAGLLNLEPWDVLVGDDLRSTYAGLCGRYPKRRYIPFAARQDNHDTACWDERASEIVIVHDFASPGWERQETYPSFHAWLRRAVEDFIEWGEEELQL